MRARAQKREGMVQSGRGMERGDVEGPLLSATPAGIGDCPVTIGTNSVVWSGDWRRRGTKTHKGKERERQREKNVERGEP